MNYFKLNFNIKSVFRLALTLEMPTDLKYYYLLNGNWIIILRKKLRNF